MEEEKRQRLFNQKVASPGFWTVPSSFQPEKETETERQRQRDREVTMHTLMNPKQQQYKLLSTNMLTIQ